MLPKIPKRLDSLTEFYNKTALVIGDHPQTGKTARCKGAFRWVNRWYMVFEDTITKLRFTVDSPSNIAWAEERKES